MDEGAAGEDFLYTGGAGLGNGFGVNVGDEAYGLAGGGGNPCADDGNDAGLIEIGNEQAGGSLAKRGGVADNFIRTNGGFGGSGDARLEEQVAHQDEQWDVFVHGSPKVYSSHSVEILMMSSCLVCHDSRKALLAEFRREYPAAIEGRISKEHIPVRIEKVWELLWKNHQEARSRMK